MKRLILGVVALAAVAVVPAHAGHTQQVSGCAISVDGADATNAQVLDPAGDWAGLVTGNGQGAAGTTADVYGNGHDILASWIARDGKGLHANIQIANMLPVEPNSMFFVQFDWPLPGDPADGTHLRKWVSVTTGDPQTTAANGDMQGADYEWGYLGPSSTPTGGDQYYTTGTTTGSVTSGTPGTITIDIPSALVDPSVTGEFLTNILVTASTLEGSVVAIPSPSPLHHGLVSPDDDSTNAGSTSADDPSEVCDAAL